MERSLTEPTLTDIKNSILTVTSAQRPVNLSTMLQAQDKYYVLPIKDVPIMWAQAQLLGIPEIFLDVMYGYESTLNIYAGECLLYFESDALGLLFAEWQWQKLDIHGLPSKCLSEELLTRILTELSYSTDDEY